jgi:hypothetical protein
VQLSSVIPRSYSAAKVEANGAAAPQQAAVSSTASAEELLEQAFEQQWSDSDEGEEDDAAAAHASPFFGALKTSCDVEGCIVTPLPLGRFYHRCAASNAPRAKHKRPASSATALSTTPATPASSLSCRGLLLWSLPGSLSLRIGDRDFVPSPFRRLGVFQPREEVEAERNERQQWMRKQQQTHADDTGEQHTAMSDA